MNKTMLALATALLFSACAGNTNPDFPYYGEEVSNFGAARLHGTVFDNAFDDDADLWINSYDGWMDLSANTEYQSGGTTDMFFLMGELEPREIFTPGVHAVNPLTTELLLCGETDGEYYDEPADDIEIEVTEPGDGLILARIRGERGDRFQEVEFMLDAETLAPVAQ